MAKQPKRFGYTVPDYLPLGVQAASLMMGILRDTKTTHRSQLEAMPDHIVLSEEQKALLRSHRVITDIIDLKAPTTTIAVCPECQAIYVLAGTAAPARCTMLKEDCGGKPEKATRPNKIELE